MKLKKVNYKAKGELTGYLYRHIRLDTGDVFYVGISFENKDGKFKRAYKNDKGNRNKFWWNITSKTEYEVEIILENLSEYELKEKEKEFIKIYGRRNLLEGTLTNLTDGGDGCVGAIKPMSERQRLAMIGKPRPKEVIEKVSRALKGRPKPPEHLKKLQAGAKISNEKRKKKIIQKTLNGDIVKIWDCNWSCMKAGYHRGFIIKCCNGTKDTYKKFRWEYYDQAVNVSPKVDTVAFPLIMDTNSTPNVSPPVAMTANPLVQFGELA